jgi:hypothetical protein
MINLLEDDSMFISAFRVAFEINFGLFMLHIEWSEN